MLPPRLYKYLPDQYVDALVGQGKLWFRSLSYFQRAEDPERGDSFESMHVDRPGGGVTITNLRTGHRLTGDFAFVNRVTSDQIYCFCVSLRKDADLFKQFRSSACVEVLDVREFLRRWCRAVGRLKSSSEWALLHRPVEYYEIDRSASLDIKNPRNLPFFKLARFAHQREYRLVTARNSAFELIQEIVEAREHDFAASSEESQVGEIPFKLGSLADITRVHRV